MHKTRNRLIAALLTFAMCLSVISPLSAFAEATTVIAEVGAASYKTLDDAITAANGSEIKLIANVTLNKTVEISSTVNLNLNGQTLTAPEAGGAALKVATGGSLTVKDDTTTVGAIAGTTGIEVAGGTLTVNAGATITATTGVSVSSGTVNINAGTVGGESTTTGVSVTGGTVNISGGTVKGTTNGVNMTAGAVNISGGTVTGGTADGTDGTDASVNASGGTLTINGGTIGKANETKIAVKLTGTAEGKLQNKDAAIYATYMGVDILNSNGTEPIKFTMTAGTITSMPNKSGATSGVTTATDIYADKESYGVYVNGKAKVQISGGSISGFRGVYANTALSEEKNTSATTITVSGGAITGIDLAIADSDNKDTGTKLNRSRGIYVLGNVAVTVDGATITAAQGIMAMNKASVTTGENHATNIVATNAASMTGIWLGDGATGTINEHTTIGNSELTTGTPNWGIVVEGYYGSVISDGGNSGLNKDDQGDKTAGSQLTVNGGSINGTAWGVAGIGNKQDAYTNITINDGTIKGGSHGIYHPQIGVLTINGGTITGDGAAVGIKAGTLNITGGTLQATGADSTPTAGYSNGLELSGTAIQIESNDSYGKAYGAGTSPQLEGSDPDESIYGTHNITVNISGNATITSANSYAIYEYIGIESEKATSEHSHLQSLTISGNPTITGGTYQSTDTPTVTEKYAAILTSAKAVEQTAANAETPTAFKITGGTFSSNLDITDTDGQVTGTYVSNGYKAVANEDNDGNVTSYTVQAIGTTDSTTYQLTANESFTALPEGYNTFDLNGYTLTYTGTTDITSSVSFIDSNAARQITNAGTDADKLAAVTKGELKLTGDSAKIAPASGSTVTLENITVTADLDATNGKIEIKTPTTVTGTVTGKSENFTIPVGTKFSADPNGVLASGQGAVKVEDEVSADNNLFVVYTQIKLKWDTQPTVTKSADFAGTAAVSGTPTVKLAEELTGDAKTLADNYVTALNALLATYTWNATLVANSTDDVAIYPANVTDFDFDTWLTTAISTYTSSNGSETNNIAALKNAKRFSVSGNLTAKVTETTAPTIMYQGKAAGDTIDLTYGESAKLSVYLPADYDSNTEVHWNLQRVENDTTTNVDKVASINKGSITAKGAGTVQVVATIGAEGSTQTVKTVTLNVKAQDPIITANAKTSNPTINGIPTEDKIKAAFDISVVDGIKYTDLLAESNAKGTLEYKINEDENSATITFKPTDTTKYNEAKTTVSWTPNIIELKLDIASGELTQSGLEATGATFKLVTNEKNGTEPSDSELSVLKEAIAGVQTWSIASDDSLYPKTFSTGSSVTNPKSWVAYINDQLKTTSYKLVAAYKIGDEDKDTVSATKQEVYTQKYETVADSEEESIELGNNKTTTKTDLLNDIMGELQVTDKDTIPSQGETTDSEGTVDLQKAKVVASAVYDVTFENESGKTQNTDFAGGQLKVYLPYPEIPTETPEEEDKAEDNAEAPKEETINATPMASGEEGDDAESAANGTEAGATDTTINLKDYWSKYTLVVAHAVAHDESAANYGEIEYFAGDDIECGEDGLYVYVSSLSTFAVLAVDGEVTLPSTATEATPSEDTASVAPAAKDDSGAIILAGAVVATVVVGGIIYYNWDKLPVHKIEGTVVDANGAAVANATVTLAKDGKVVKTVTTDANGYYSAKVAKGDYTITVTVGEASATAEGSTGASAQLAIA
jgi:hypothetical protein